MLQLSSYTSEIVCHHCTTVCLVVQSLCVSWSAQWFYRTCRQHSSCHPEETNNCLKIRHVVALRVAMCRQSPSGQMCGMATLIFPKNASMERVNSSSIVCPVARLNVCHVLWEVCSFQNVWKLFHVIRVLSSLIVHVQVEITSNQ